jgi:membrane fusion protein, copper/silver efflux system
MQAYVTIKKREHSMLSLPVNAVLRDSKGATVWIMTSNYTFKNRMVEIGMETRDRIEIRSGLKEGDIVVVTGAYLLNSEYVFKNGADPMAGMKM